jgi:hypothetical protein
MRVGQRDFARYGAKVAERIVPARVKDHDLHVSGRPFPCSFGLHQVGLDLNLSIAPTLGQPLPYIHAICCGVAGVYT